jgi:fructan beta-fructosidase
MHWGHATSTDLVHWQHQPVALYPDSLGYIFSGSVVADINNTSQFGANSKTPLVAIFTHHDPKGEKEGRSDFQNQSLAYSLDNGLTWIKYKANPVLKNPGITDFRDPKVSWYNAGQKWIMSLATKDRITFYSSPNLKDWMKESEFGKGIGAHGGVWECPDLFPLAYNGKNIWVLLVSINPGGPNGGSATQYFTGEFDGHSFTPFDTKTRWIDYGPDDYAGVTWSNTGSRKIFIGWMSNWQYGQVVPTSPWRSAMTVPRDLFIRKINNEYLLCSLPVPELQRLSTPTSIIKEVHTNNYTITSNNATAPFPAIIKLNADSIKSFSFVLSNTPGDQLIIGFKQESNQYFIDRSRSGKTGFEKGFAGIHYSPRLTNDSKLDITLVIDNASVEMFADNGLSVMTEIFFPLAGYTSISIQSPVDFKLNSLEYTKLRSIH